MDKKMTRAEIAAARSVAKTLRVSRRSLQFFIRTILLILLIGLLCAGSFLTAARLSNLYIIINEGMTLRAASLLRGGDDPDLLMYFTADCIRSDAALRSVSIAPYADYTITDYEYDLNVDSMHVFPWQSSVYAEVTEQITSMKGSSSVDGSSGVPAWTPIRYRLRFERVDGRWYISLIELVELNPTLPVANTPDPNRSPIPMVTPTPAPTPVEIEFKP